MMADIPEFADEQKMLNLLVEHSGLRDLKGEVEQNQRDHRSRQRAAPHHSLHTARRR